MEISRTNGLESGYINLILFTMKFNLILFNCSIDRSLSLCVRRPNHFQMIDALFFVVALYRVIVIALPELSSLPKKPSDDHNTFMMALLLFGE